SDSWQPWINRRLDRVELARDAAGELQVQIDLRQHQPAPPGTYLQAEPKACWPSVAAGDGTLEGLSDATRERVHAIRSRFAGPLWPLPTANLPSARSVRTLSR